MTPPKAVRDLAHDLREACGAEPAVEFDVGLTHWRVIMENARVLMTLDFKMTSSGRWVWTSSTLAIDGVQGPLSQGFEHFVRVWKDPGEMVNKAPVPPPLSTPVVVVELDAMPRHIARAIRTLMEKGIITDPVIGYVDEHFWAVEFLFPRAVLRMHYYRNSDSPIPCDHLYLIIDGEDKSDLAKGQMDKALAVIASIPHPGVAGTASIDGAAGTQRDRGVEVRSTHVMRT